MQPLQLRVAVLGLIAERPRHGYDVEQVIEQRGIRQWTDIGFSSIYCLLTKLEKRGLIRVPAAPAGVKSRRVFQATSAGREAATRNALVLIAELRAVPHPLLVGLVNLPMLSEQEYAEALRTRLVQVEARIAAVAEVEQAQASLALPAREVFSYSLSLMEAERSWLAARVQVIDDRQD